MPHQNRNIYIQYDRTEISKALAAVRVGSLNLIQASKKYGIPKTLGDTATWGGSRLCISRKEDFIPEFVEEQVIKVASYWLRNRAVVLESHNYSTKLLTFARPLTSKHHSPMGCQGKHGGTVLKVGTQKSPYGNQHKYVLLFFH